MIIKDIDVFLLNAENTAEEKEAVKKLINNSHKNMGNILKFGSKINSVKIVENRKGFFTSNGKYFSFEKIKFINLEDGNGEKPFFLSKEGNLILIKESLTEVNDFVVKIYRIGSGNGFKNGIKFVGMESFINEIEADLETTRANF